jgi:hypothetical protein
MENINLTGGVRLRAPFGFSCICDECSHLRRGEICGEITANVPPSRAFGEACFVQVRDSSTTSTTSSAEPDTQAPSQLPTVSVTTAAPSSITGRPCGNGIIDAGEKCDDNSTCCDPLTCRFRIGATCSLESACCSKCNALPSTVRCAQDGFCSNGECVQSDCSRFGLSFCGMSPVNSCRQRCIYQNYCSDMAWSTAVFPICCLCFYQLFQVCGCDDAFWSERRHGG